MNRADKARTNIADEIPFARRSRPIRTYRKLTIGSLLIFSLIFCILLFLYSSSFNQPWFSKGPLGSQLAVPASDGRLLGHFPYPEASSDELIAVYPGLEIHQDTYKALRSMRAAASADGIKLVLLSGYRSIKLQKQIFYSNKSRRNQIAIERAKVSAPPGYSEHSTGYAIDLGDAGYRDTDLEVSFEGTPAFRWLKQNAAKYHFVLSFPRGNPQKVSYEPWHWRYEGTVNALRQFESANELRRSVQVRN